MKQYPTCCLSAYCGEIACRGCKNEKYLIAYYGMTKHSELQYNGAWTLAHEINKALGTEQYKNDFYYNQLAGRN